MANERYISTTKTARYYLSGELNQTYRSVCFVLHGYGQLARYFIRPFTAENLKRILFVAPEGLHRFYLQGSKGRVGASWMTRDDRLNDIEDYCLFLDKVLQELLPGIRFEKEPSIGVLGFSQGVATACRWLSNSRQGFHYLINYAGLYPPDLPVEKAIEKMQQIPVLSILGTDDEYISEERFRESLEAFYRQGFPKNLLMYEGEHKIYPEVLQSCFKSLELLT